MKILYTLDNIRNEKGKVLDGWKILISRMEYSAEYQATVFYKDGCEYWVSLIQRDLVDLINKTIDEIDWIVNNIPEDALNSKQQWSHVKSFGNYGSREFIMLCKCNGRAELKRFKHTDVIFCSTNEYIPDNKELLNENYDYIDTYDSSISEHSNIDRCDTEVDVNE